MLTKVVFEGALGERFGREWNIHATSPTEALRIINANRPELSVWLRGHARKYSHYQVVVEREDGSQEILSEKTYLLDQQMVTLRYVPVIEGSGKWVGVIVGVIIMIVAIIYGAYTGDWVNAAALFKFGAEMAVVGLITAMTTKSPKRTPVMVGHSAGKSLASEMFSAVAENTQQGYPVPIIYGRERIETQVVSSNLSISDAVQA